MEIGQKDDRHKLVLKLLVLIVDWDKVKKVKDILKSQLVRFQYVVLGRGTAHSEILNVLGIGSVDKGIVLCLQPECCVDQIMRNTCAQMGFDHPGKGIAFTLPLSGACNPAIQMFTESQLDKLAQGDGAGSDAQLLRRQSRERCETDMDNAQQKTVASDAQYDLILAVVNQGYSDSLMEKARAAGATGGTIINARRIGTEDMVKFLGISIQEEKEVLAILASHQAKNSIMLAINQFFGFASDAKGIVFALPVDGVEGLNLTNSQ